MTVPTENLPISDAQIDVVPDEIDAASSYVAPPWRLVWWRFRKHRLALVSGIIILIIYFIAFFAGFFAPADPRAVQSKYTSAPPQPIHLFDDGRFAPYVNGYESSVDVLAGRRDFTIDETQIIRIGLFVKGPSYRIGFGDLSVEWDVHLIGPTDPNQPFYILGADHLGRDVLSRIIFGAQVSMSIGLVGVLASLLIGITVGGISGYVGGWVDNLIQRVIDFVRSIPTIPLWLGLAAALPLTWSPLKVYFAITVLLSLIGWTDIARVVRSRFLSLRNEDFVVAARLDGEGTWSIIMQQMLPSFYSHIIATLTLAIPQMIIAETSLSFLGLGLRAPAISWGVLLQDAQNLRTLSNAPWMLAPAGAVIIAVLALNFLGDGLRDAADPYA